MKITEYGEANPDVIMMIHGGGLSWWNYREEAQLLSGRYHVVLPVIDGHADTDRNFVSIEDNARALADYIKDVFGGRIKALCGLSLGAQIAVELLSQNPAICEFAVIESASLIPSAAAERLIGPAFSLSYGLVKRRWFARWQFASLRINAPLFEDYYRDTCRITRENMISFMKASTGYALKDSIAGSQAAIRVIAGAKEQRSVIESARLLCVKAGNATLVIKDGLYHGEFSLNRPREYAEELEAFMGAEPALQDIR